MNILFACEMSILPPGRNSGGTEQAIACLKQELEVRGHEATVISWDCFDNKPKLRTKYSWVCQILDGLGKLDIVNITTHGPLGFLVRRYCKARGIPFTTTYHTRIPLYLKNHGFPIWLSELYFRWFLNGATKSIAPTQSMADGLKDIGVRNAVACGHGVDTELFQPGDKKEPCLDMPRPYWVSVSRIVKEKNLEPILETELPGTLFVIGDGPLLATYRSRYPHARFLGAKHGQELADLLGKMNVLLFASKTDTFGLVLLEAEAAGVSVAALPYTGPIDVITDSKVGCLSYDLLTAAKTALELDPLDCRAFALQHSWPKATERFLQLQTVAGPPRGGALRLWFERWFNLPMIVLEPIVYRVNHLLF